MTVYKTALTTGTRSVIRPGVICFSHPPTPTTANQTRSHVTTQTATARQHPSPHTATARRALPGGLGEARPPPGPRLGPPAPSLLHGEAHEAAPGFRHRTGTELGDEPGGAGVRVPGGAGEGHACLEAVTVCWQGRTICDFARAVGGLMFYVRSYPPFRIWLGTVFA